MKSQSLQAVKSALLLSLPLLVLPAAVFWKHKEAQAQAALAAEDRAIAQAWAAKRAKALVILAKRKRAQAATQQLAPPYSFQYKPGVWLTPAQLRKLIALGADVNAQDGHGHTLLQAIAFNNDGRDQIALARILLAHGANPNVHAWAMTASPLMTAIERVDAPLVRLLVRNGADVNLPCADLGRIAHADLSRIANADLVNLARIANTALARDSSRKLYRYFHSPGSNVTFPKPLYLARRVALMLRRRPGEIFHGKVYYGSPTEAEQIVRILKAAGAQE